MCGSGVRYCSCLKQNKLQFNSTSSPVYHQNNSSSSQRERESVCCLGKLFCSILCKRILDFLEEHSILSKSQIGFLLKHRTSDHVYTLHTLINKHVHQTKKCKIFTCFIDLLMLLFDDLVLLSPTEQGLQQQLDTVEQYCRNWALAVNMKKTDVMIFQKCPRCQENKHQFTISNHVTEHSMSYTDLGTITITASGSSNMAEMH